MKKLMQRVLFAACLMAILVGAYPAAAQEAASPAPPDWYRADIAAMTRDGGRWVADNSTRRSEAEPFDQYVIEWRLAPDGLSMTGRLFGIQGGRESADFWHFRQFWHPGERQAYVMQWGRGGMYGVGILTPMGEAWGTLAQTFHMADGRTFRLGHVYRNVGPDERVAEQYDILTDQGIWRLDHALTFRRARVRR